MYPASYLSHAARNRVSSGGGLGLICVTCVLQNQNANNRKDLEIDSLQQQVIDLKAAQRLQSFYAQDLVESLENERNQEVREPLDAQRLMIDDGNGQRQPIGFTVFAVRIACQAKLTRQSCCEGSAIT